MRKYLIGALGGFVLASTVAVAVPLTGPQDVSRFNQIINSELLNYISFTGPGRTGEVTLNSPQTFSGTSIIVMLPTGSVRYIQTSATP